MDKWDWIQEYEEADCYDTSCNNSFYLNDGTPVSHNMKYCYICGKEINQILYEEYNENNENNQS